MPGQLLLGRDKSFVDPVKALRRPHREHLVPRSARISDSGFEPRPGFRPGIRSVRPRLPRPDLVHADSQIVPGNETELLICCGGVSKRFPASDRNTGFAFLRESPAWSSV